MQSCWVSICEHAPFAHHQEHQFAVLKAYFDGSGKSHDSATPFLTLAGYAAQTVYWPAFETAWAQVLSRNKIDGLHFKEPQIRENPLLVGELLDLIQSASHFGMRSVSCTVDIEKLKRSSSQRPGFTCVEWCVNTLLEETSSMSCFFDRGEEFFDEIRLPWENDARTWSSLEKVKELGVVRGRDYPGVQAADWLAWYINRAVTRGDHDIDFSLLARRTRHRAVIKP